MKYFAIYINMDGDINVRSLGKTNLENALNEEYWGNPVFLGEVPDSDPQYWLKNKKGSPGALLIIKGEIVKPKPVHIVKSWEVE